MLDGPVVRLSPKAVQNVGLALHELCTNAIKYGALKHASGGVNVHWAVTGDTLHLTWTEHGGPTVRTPTRKGFGRIVSEQAVSSALNATVKMDFAPAGIVWTLSLDTQHFTLRSDRPEPRT